MAQIIFYAILCVGDVNIFSTEFPSSRMSGINELLGGLRTLRNTPFTIKMVYLFIFLVSCRGEYDTQCWTSHSLLNNRAIAL